MVENVASLHSCGRGACGGGCVVENGEEGGVWKHYCIMRVV